MSKIQIILSYINIGLLAFMSVIMIFHSSLSLPQWLTYVGRLHPLLIHLPIGMYILVIMLMLIRNKFESTAIQPILYFIVSVSTLVTMLSIIAGLFLSLEKGYVMEETLWHRNTAFAFGISQYLLYMIFEKSKSRLIYILSSISALLLIISSHLGANITHGKNFLFPDADIETLPIDPNNHSLYDIAIQPIFNDKCTSCHNLQKSKGSLNLSDSNGIKKGGEHGMIFIAGNAAASKIVQSLLLPLKDKQHMPPDGKPQLSAEEKNLIRLWIASGASFIKKIAQYKDSDSIKILTSGMMVNKNTERVYSFDAVSSSTLDKLQSPYLAVSPLSSNSPALEASFFVSAAFSNDNLQKLNVIKKQLIALNLNAMPLNDQSIEHILKLTALEKLILNGCGLTDAQFQKLTLLPKLESLSVSNNDLHATIEKSFQAFPSLKKLYLNHTSIDYKAIQGFEKKYSSIKFYVSPPKSELMALTSPVLKNESNVLKKGEAITLHQFIKDAKIRYTTNGTEPDSVKSPIYTRPIEMKSSMTIKAISVKEGWLKSPVSTYPIFSEGIKVESCNLLTNANVQYPGTGNKTIINQEKAAIGNLKDPNWIAFREVPFNATFTLKDAVPIEKIAFCYGIQIPAYVFPPVYVRVYGSNTLESFQFLKEIKTATITPSSKDEVKTDHLEISLNGSRFKYYKIEAQNLVNIPQWHPGKGERGWLFIDEIFFYAK